MGRVKSFWKAVNTPGASGGQDMLLFTPDAQEALSLSHLEAKRLKCNYVGTEHLLLGIIRLGRGVAFKVLKKMGVVLETVQSEIEKQLGVGCGTPSGRIPYTPRVKKVLTLAAREAKALNHQYVGTADVLLGMLQEGDGVAARVLVNLGVNVEQTRSCVLQELDPNAYAIELPAAAISGEDGEEKPEKKSVDLTKRYDIHCQEVEREVVYRNALFIGTKRLFNNSIEFIAIEQSDGEVVLVSKASITKFREHKAQARA